MRKGRKQKFRRSFRLEMGNNAGRISMWKKATAMPKDAATFVRLSEYCKEKFVTPPIVRRKIQGNKIRAFKFRGRWYVKEFADSRYGVDYR